MRSVKYYEVAPRVVVRADSGVFTYASETPLMPGQLVEVSIGRKRSAGIVWREVPQPDFDAKLIDNVLDAPPLPLALLTTTDWMAAYYDTHLATVLQTMLPAGLTKKRRIKAITTPEISRKRTHILLTKDQQRALDSLTKTPHETTLLHGVTGSGKTAVYIEYARHLLAQGKSAIVLVPEIALTSQIVADFQHHFSDIILTHSRQTEAERHRVWLDALQRSTPAVAIGPRSALFLPLADVGAIIIDECHEPSFKQDAAPRYQAQRVARVLATQHGGSVVLGSATPSIGDYYLATTHNHPIIRLDRPAIDSAVTPEVSIVDMTKRANFSQHRFLSDQLLANIKQSLTAGHQILLFHNRRGSAATTLCEACGWQAGCGRCYVPLTLHSDKHQLLCHVCGTTSRVPTSCPSCGAADIIHKGIGTKLIESEVAKLFPTARIARFDGDTTSGDTTEKRYQELYDGDIDIIIGTQVIAKGLDLPHLRTVGVIQADAGLSLPDYTSAERVFQLLTQVIGRVGRSTHPTRVIIQSYQPDHPAVRDGITRDYDSFYQRTIALRQHTNFPPFCYLLRLTCIYKTEATAIKHAKAMATTIRHDYPQVEVLGPTPAFYERVHDTYRWQLVIKSSQRQQLQAIAHTIPAKHWQIDLDPVSLL